MKLPVVPQGCVHNAHMFYIKAADLEERTALIQYLKENGILSVFHYIPLHTAPPGGNSAASTGRTDILQGRAKDWQGFLCIMV